MTVTRVPSSSNEEATAALQQAVTGGVEPVFMKLAAIGMPAASSHVDEQGDSVQSGADSAAATAAAADQNQVRKPSNTFITHLLLLLLCQSA